ncbi:MAG: UbiD family decarboxylase [Anaerolineae bacterium]|nr:UbiD family decarboxylase [Anaerolineae bacterium]
MSAIHDLRSFLAVLDSANLLAHVITPCSLVHEIADVAAAITRRQGKAALFEHPNAAAWPVFAGAVANRHLAAVALQCLPEDIPHTMGCVLDPGNGIPPQRDATAVWKANVHTGSEIDVRRLPIPTHGVHDGGPFITGGVTVTRDPVTGRGNLSYNRMQVLGPHTLGFNVNEWRHVMQFYKVQESRGAPLEVAIAIGLDPAIMIAAGARYDADELFIAGAIRGAGIPVSRGVTVDIDIPAGAEIVIEGHLPPQKRAAEGPLAEFHGYYGELWQSPVLEVTAICHRDAPIFQTIIPGAAEHIYLGNVLPREPLLLHFVRHVSKNILNLHIPAYGNGFAAIVQLSKSHPGEPKNVALAAMTAHVNIKKVIVVDPDVNIYDAEDVMWALTNRVDWSCDTFIVPGSQGHEMDPTADARGVHTKIGIDATYKPERRDYGERIRYPDVDLNRYVT